MNPNSRFSNTPPPANAPFDATKAKEHQEAWTRHLGVEGETVSCIGMQFRVIPPGKVPKSGRDDAHLITFGKPFLFGTHEVTQGQYEQVMGVQPTTFKGANVPTHGVCTICTAMTRTIAFPGIKTNRNGYIRQRRVWSGRTNCSASCLTLKASRGPLSPGNRTRESRILSRRICTVDSRTKTK